MAVVMENGSGSRLQLFLKSLLPSLFSNVSLFSLFKTSRPPFCNNSLLLQNCFAPQFLLLSFCFGLPLLLQNFPPGSFLSFSKNRPPFLLVPPLVFISRGGEDHLTPAMAQGKVGDGSCWQGMVSVSFFFHNACRVWLFGYGSCGFFGK